MRLLHSVLHSRLHTRLHRLLWLHPGLLHALLLLESAHRLLLEGLLRLHGWPWTSKLWWLRLRHLLHLRLLLQLRSTKLPSGRASRKSCLMCLAPLLLILAHSRRTWPNRL